MSKSPSDADDNYLDDFESYSEWISLDELLKIEAEEDEGLSEEEKGSVPLPNPYGDLFDDYGGVGDD